MYKNDRYNTYNSDSFDELLVSYLNTSVRPISLFILQTLLKPPTSIIPVMKMHNIPVMITKPWNTSVQITALIPPYDIANELVELWTVMLLLMQTSFNESYRNGIKFRIKQMRAEDVL